MDDRYEDLVAAINAGNVQAGVSEAVGLVEAGVAPAAIFVEAIQPTLVQVGERFSRLQIFLPEMIGAADVVKAIQDELRPHLEAQGEATSQGRIVIATVAGDLHDIGKNIVKSMLEVNGFEVKDLGVDVDANTIVQAALDFQADIIGLSALMLPSLPYAQDTIELARAHVKSGRDMKIMVGGGPVTQAWAQKVGADGYGDDAIQAVKLAKSLMQPN